MGVTDPSPDIEERRRATPSPAPRQGDAFGQLLLATLDVGVKPGVETEIVERDDGLIVAADAVRYFRRPEEWSPQVRWAVAQARGRVLDIGIGAGQHALVAQRAGCRVTGLDVSPGALEVARRRGVGELVAGSVGQVAEFFEQGSFDTVFMLGQNLALLGSPERAGAVLSALYDITAPGALLIGDGADPTPVWESQREYFESNVARGRWPGHFTLRVRHRDMASPWFDYLFCTPDQLAALGETHGWRLHGVRQKGASYAAVMHRL
ncbi:class I SAM-dependent methyltransferase [Streptomyces radicis]|uniref:Class I SAM-dependent methyltransferase n=1 Tax=Streptomyces radicis TaxID=1750517 RepID=A0A3A9VU43_9ACTN|nr:class I SAM-dependent methyltransferase [Streptomyces radicis]RKN04260.1 class I SAM-dependent methyltransferase [Streptomyces radicis]RKN14778.1 class I SAM-dependent methyltransferase [Streptomyces radicis]